MRKAIVPLLLVLLAFGAVPSGATDPAAAGRQAPGGVLVGRVAGTQAFVALALGHGRALAKTTTG